MASTDALLARVSATPGPIYGRFTDKEVYRLLLAGDVDVFVELTRELADAVVDAGVDRVAGDAGEGFNPSHDVWRFVIDGAVALASRITRGPIDNRDFLLDGRPDACPEALRERATWLRLDEAALDRKIDAAMRYPELRGEVDAALAHFGRRAFAVECLRPVSTEETLGTFAVEPPLFERYGQMRVGEGRYQEVIRYVPHVLPVRIAIEAAVHGRVANAVQ
jgi:AcrR family transcriptional regulator